MQPQGNKDKKEDKLPDMLPLVHVAAEVTKKACLGTKQTSNKK